MTPRRFLSLLLLFYLPLAASFVNIIAKSRESINPSLLRFEPPRKPRQQRPNKNATPTSPWLRTSVDFERDDPLKIAVDFTTVLASTILSKISSATASPSFEGWGAPVTGESLRGVPSIVVEASVICACWLAACLRDDGFARDLADTRLARYGAKRAHSSRDALILVVLSTSNSWLFCSVLVAALATVGLGGGSIEDLALADAFMLPALVAERSLLYISDQNSP